MGLSEVDLEGWPSFIGVWFPDPFTDIGTEESMVIHNDESHVDDLGGRVRRHAEHSQFLEILDRVEDCVDRDSGVILDGLHGVLLSDQLCWSHLPINTEEIL